MPVPAGLQPPILNGRWASESSSQMFDEPERRRTDGAPAHGGTAVAATDAASVFGPKLQQPPRTWAGAGTAAVASLGAPAPTVQPPQPQPQHQPRAANGGQAATEAASSSHGRRPGKAGDASAVPAGIDAAKGDDGDADGGMMGEGRRGGAPADARSPWDRTPPPPPPVFDYSIPRPRFIAKIMRWYQVVELWCDERQFARYDRDRLIVAPPPRPPLFVEGDALFTVPDAARLSPYPVNAWVMACHRWWDHVHAHFHRIQTQVLGQSVVIDKARQMDRSHAAWASLVARNCVCGSGFDDLASVLALGDGEEDAGAAGGADGNGAERHGAESGEGSTLELWPEQQQQRRG